MHQVAKYIIPEMLPYHLLMSFHCWFTIPGVPTNNFVLMLCEQKHGLKQYSHCRHCIKCFPSHVSSCLLEFALSHFLLHAVLWTQHRAEHFWWTGGCFTHSTSSWKERKRAPISLCKIHTVALPQDRITESQRADLYSRFQEISCLNLNVLNDILGTYLKQWHNMSLWNLLLHPGQAFQ